MTEITDISVSPARSQFILFGENVGGRWDVNRSATQVQGLLFKSVHHFISVLGHREICGRVIIFLRRLVSQPFGEVLSQK